MAQRHRETDAPTHRVPHQVKGVCAHEVKDVLGGLFQRAGDMTRAAMAGKIDGDDRTMLAEQGAERPPGRRVLGEPVAEHEQRSRSPRGRSERGHHR